MITKVKANKSFRGTTKYVLDKEKAKIIGGNMYGQSTNELVEQFTLSAHLNPQLKDPCYHLMLSVPKTDRTLNDDELANLSQRHLASVVVLSQLKGDESQVKQPDKRIADTKLKELVDEFIETELPAYDFFIARHSDKEHDHTHIVASRVNNLDGKSIRTWNNYAHSEHSARLLEREFQLTPVQSSWESKQKAMTRNQLERVESLGLPGEEIMRRAIEQVAADKPTMPQLIERLWREHQVKAIVSYYGHGGVRGIRFGIDIGSVNEDGSPRLLWKQGGNLNKYKCSFTKLQTELGINYDPKRDDSEIKHLNNFLESVDNSQQNQQLIPTTFPNKSQNIAKNKHQLNPAKLDVEQRSSSELINTISDFIEQSVVESTLIETLPQLAEQLSEYQQNLSAVRTTYDELLAAIAEREQLLSQRTVDAIADFIEQSVVDDALSETLPQLTEKLSQYHQQLANNKTTLDELSSAITDVEQRLVSQRAVDAIANFIEQSAVDNALVETLPQLAEQLSQYNQQLSAGRTAFDDLLAAIDLSEQLRSQRIVDAIANFIEQSTVESTLSETLPQLAEQLSQYRQQSDAGRTAFDELSSAITQELQSHTEKKAILSISDYIEQSTVESALTEAVLELTQQLSQYKEQLVTAKTTFNDLDAVLATELQSYLEKRAILSISDYVEQSTVESALTETVLELTHQLSQNQQQLSAGRTIFDDLEAAIVYLEKLHRSQKPVDAIALNQTPPITTDKPKLKEEQTAELYEYYSAHLQNLLVTDRDKEIAIRALKDNKPFEEVEEIIFASPAGWTQDEARELVLIASNKLATQKSEPEQSLDEKQRQEEEFLAEVVPIAVELINWQLRQTGSNSLIFKRATLEKQGRELVFTHDERGEIFRVAVNRNQSGELEYSSINVGEIEKEDIQLWQKAERLLQQIIEEQQQSKTQSKGISL
ncbi:relaxase/mobilization nuclease domain-containing protein [Nostoc sp. UHCC 0252]|uniref:relaxase/mobilization nuclease domain-containing protein n=1 Tax=Nostoc sp. UHCC 0252 TaxID=3110241 RepID=UPI002B1FEE32|nr:relaxase/mobilization nuclease domain-containing protein [Nostoc sp. UHCC 0252]MEA5605673.1 relaxase/mobilization nuclease domain-containing protein [Nostoc sp. UHCC 0252]